MSLLSDLIEDLRGDVAWWVGRAPCLVGRHRPKFNGGDVRCRTCYKKLPIPEVELPNENEET